MSFQEILKHNSWDEKESVRFLDLWMVIFVWSCILWVLSGLNLMVC